MLKDHKAVTPVRLEPAALLSRVKHSSTEPLRSLVQIIKCRVGEVTSVNPVLLAATLII